MENRSDLSVYHSNCEPLHPLFCILKMAGEIVLKFGKRPISQAFYRSWGWGWDTAAHAHMHTTFLYLRNSWMDGARPWLVVRGPSAQRFTKISGGVHAPVHVSTPFPYLGNGWMACADTWCVVRRARAVHSTHDGDIHTGTHVTVYMFEHISSPPPPSSFITQKESYWY